ncbi:zinc ABC transporter permease AztB [Nocardia rhizosphaerae]|uniref:Zinc ABC transporter permease AztB n=1 Tax=Nocardia rhizosphaerae TaxID=1691571 RepID=A0ABV8L8N1_9NOCA
MDWLVTPFEVAFVQRALWGGLLVSCVCALAGTWVVVRGMAFLGDAMAHGMLPGVAVAALLGGNLIIGAAVSCAAMAFGVSMLGRSKRFAPDTAIGLLFVGMLAAGVIIVSRSQSFAVDLTGFLFGDVLAVRGRDLMYLGVALVIALLVTVLGHRAFVASTFDPRKAHTLGLRPTLAQVALVGLVTLAIVASFHVVGTLLVFGLLIAPPAAAMYWSDRIPVVMVLAALLGAVSTAIGLLISWHAGTAAGATIAAVAVGTFFLSALAAALRDRFGARKLGAASVAALAAVPLVGCGSGETTPAAEETPHGYVAGAEEQQEAQTRLVVADADGAVLVVDLLSEQVTTVDGLRADHARPSDMAGVRLAGDGRYGYVSGGGRLTIVDSGAWTVDHGDHKHYYAAPIRTIGTVDADAHAVAAHSDPALAAVVLDSGQTLVFDRTALDQGSVPRARRVDGIAVPYGERLVVADDAGRVEVRPRDDSAGQPLPAPCPQPRGQAVTRRGLVFGCADGALVVTRRDGEFAAEKIAYPAPGADRATAFTHRPGSPTLTALAGRDGVWTLDIRKRTWSRLAIADPVAVNTAGESSAVLVLTGDGVLHGLGPETGAAQARLELLPRDAAGAATIQVDPARAYVNDTSGRMIHEIAYNDNLRAARTFAVDIAPAHLVETGR